MQGELTTKRERLKPGDVLTIGDVQIELVDPKRAERVKITAPKAAKIAVKPRKNTAKKAPPLGPT